MQITGFHCKTHTLAVFCTRLVNKHCIACSHQNRFMDTLRVAALANDDIHCIPTSSYLAFNLAVVHTSYVMWQAPTDIQFSHVTIATVQLLSRVYLPTINSRAFASHANTRSVIVTICYNIYDKMHSVDGLLHVYMYTARAKNDWL